MKQPMSPASLCLVWGSTTTMALLAAVVMSAAAAGCTSTAPIDCGKCAPGYACNTVSGICTAAASSDGGAPDIAMGHCTPGCPSNQFCNGANKCVPCLGDSDCPAGRICKSLPGGAALCVPGCVDDARCRAAGGTMSMSCCGGQCVDISVDGANCGACNAQCTAPHAGGVCEASKCQKGKCDHDWGDCNAMPADGCETNLLTDPANCGACGNKCAFTNAVAGCASFGDGADAGPGGTGCFIMACNYGFDDCNSDPSDGCEATVLTDPKNCGACNTKCPTLPHSKLTCANAVCALTSCEVGYADCNKDAKDGCETNVNTDANNCAVCGNACGAGLICKGGGCTCPQCNIPNASAKCVNNMCIFDKCNPGYADCNNNQADGCEANLMYDAANCGVCGNKCMAPTPSCGSGQCTTLFTFPGVMQNLPVAALAGWSQCYKDTYLNSGTQLAGIWAGCSGNLLLLACRPVGAQTLQLAAMGMRADVLFDVPPGPNVNNAHMANGVGWYYDPSYSMGFAPAGDPLQRSSCDFMPMGDADKRLCWHTGGNAINTGYRCGTNILNGDATYERLIFQAN